MFPLFERRRRGTPAVCGPRLGRRASGGGEAAQTLLIGCEPAARQGPTWGRGRGRPPARARAPICQRRSDGQRCRAPINGSPPPIGRRHRPSRAGRGGKRLTASRCLMGEVVPGAATCGQSRRRKDCDSQGAPRRRPSGCCEYVSEC